MESDGSNDEADDTSHTTARPFMFDSTGDHVYIKVSSPAPPDHSLYVSTFLFQFFQASDQNKEGDIDVWLDFFTENATVEMGREERTGNMTKLRSLRERMWSGVKRRKHTVFRAFNNHYGEWPESDMGFTAMGVVEIESEDGNGSVKEWCAVGRLTRREGLGRYTDDSSLEGLPYRLTEYKVYFGGERAGHLEY